MRSPLLVALAIAVSASAAQADDNWMEYAYPDLGFAVSFPADPVMETLPYTAPDGAKVNEVLYSVRQGTEVYRVAVVDFASASLDGTTAIDQAVSLLRENGDVRLDIPARVNRNFGRQLSLVGKDGSHSTVAIFFADHRLYQIQGTVLAASDDPSSGDAIRFQQSLRFTGDTAGAGFRQGIPGQGFPGRGGRGAGRFRRNPNPNPNQNPADQPPSPPL